MFVERPSVCVLASAMDDWLLCGVGRFALCSLEHRGGWPLLPYILATEQQVGEAFLCLFH